MFFEFNFYSSILLPFVIQGFVYFFLLHYRGFREGNTPDVLLAWIIMLYTLRVASWMLGFAGWYDAHNGYTTFMFYFPFNHWFALGPLVYFYFKSLTNAQFRFKRNDLWHLLLIAIDLLDSAYTFVNDIVINHWISGTSLPYFHGTRGAFAEYGIGIFDTILESLAYLSVLSYFIITILLYRKYRQYIQEEFSKTDRIKFNWLRNFLYAIIAGQVIWLLFFAIQNLGIANMNYMQAWYSYFAWGIIIYYLSIAGYNQNYEELYKLDFQSSIIPPPEATVPPELKERQLFQTRLLKYLDEKKPYLDPELTLKELAQQLNIPSNTLSQTINQEMNQNFNELINSYRIEEVKLKLVDPGYAHLSILGVAFECGFNSKATFNRVFKKLAGQTPGEYIKSNTSKKTAQH